MQIGIPKAANVEIKIEEKTTVVFKEKFIFDFNIDVSLSSLLSISFDCSLIDGMIVTAKELISVDGIMISGNVIPIMIPNSERASVEEYPYNMSLIGIMIEMIDETTEETVRTAVIGELVFKSFLNSSLGFARVPPFLKYIMQTIIDEMTHAKLKDKAVLFVRDILRNDVLKRMIKIMILITCSINSVKLIVKKFWVPQSAPRKTS